MSANPPPDHPDPMTAPAAGPNGVQPTGEAPGAVVNAAVASVPEPRQLPTRKDASLKEFLNKMDDYAPIVRLFLGASSQQERYAD